MNEAEVFKAFLSLSGTGVFAWVMWIIAKRFMEEHAGQVKVTQAEMSKRIDATEKRNDECEQDRKVLHAKLIEVLRETKKQ